MTEKTTSVATARVSSAGPKATVGATDRAGSAGGVRVRVPLRVHPDTKERTAYWAKKAGLSVNEYMAEAVEEKIRRENLDYDLPTLELQRLNQLIDEIKALSTNIKNVESISQSGFDSLLGLTRGDNYLLDNDEDGELSRG